MAKTFDVTITETLKMVVNVNADSKEEAEQIVADNWKAGEYILDADNFVEVDFGATRHEPFKKRDSREER